MADLIVVPLKKTSDVDLVKPLKNVISSACSTADQPEDHSASIVELNKLRNSATWRTLDKHESSLEVLYKYYDQLAALESKIPPSEVQIPFKWKDAFDKGSIFGGKISLTVSSLAYEKVCILFNMAALQSQIAASQSLESDDGLKLAAKLLQQAAGIFNHLKGCVMSSIQQDPTPDLNPETLGALAALMLAQAQEIFINKAIHDRMKDVLIAKLCAQGEELYADALKQMQRETVRPLWDREWLSLVAGKQAAYHGLSEYYQSLVCNAVKNVGEQIARLQHASELLKAAQQRSGNPNMLHDYNIKIQRAYTEAKKDNDFIYHERVPDLKSLTPVEKVASAKLAKPLPIPERMSQNFKDLFENLMPVAIHQAIAAYEVRKTEIVNKEISSLRESTQMLNSILASLNLPAALEDMGGDTVPQSVLEKARAVRQAGGLPKLQKDISELPELLERNRQILDEAERLLQEEKASDDQLREQFKDQWKRTPSEKLTETFRTNSSKYRQIIDNAVQADSVVRSKFDQHKQGMEVLSTSEENIISAIPSSNPTAAIQSSPTVQQLKQKMDEVETLKAERDSIECELKSATTDMKAAFLGALAQDGAINEPAMSVEHLGQVFGPLQKQVKESLEKQERLVAEIQVLNNDFCKEKSGPGIASQREEILKELAAAHDAFMELQNNILEGTKFYNDLTQLLLTFQNKVSDYCFARKTEKEELMKDMTLSMAHSTIASPPTAPSHHQSGGADSQRQPPPRPPPPSRPESAASAPGSAPGPAPGAPPIAAASLPYPAFPQGMPMPYAQQASPYPVYTPMPQGFNPYSGYAQPPQVAYPGYPYPQQPGYPAYPQQQPPQQQQQPPRWM